MNTQTSPDHAVVEAVRERVGLDALHWLTDAADPLDWLVRAANRYGREQTRLRMRTETRTYEDRADYLRDYARRTRGSGEKT